MHNDVYDTYAGFSSISKYVYDSDFSHLLLFLLLFNGLSLLFKFRM